MSKIILKAAVIGDPISHSLSPKLHNFWLEKYKISGSYEALQVKAEDLESNVKWLIQEGYSGFNVTIPHKEKIFQLINKQGGELTRSAFAAKAVNTVVIKENGALYGHNSDCEGFLNNLKSAHPNIDFKGKSAFIIGAGGAARAIIHGLFEDAKVQNIFVTNRTKDKFDLIYSELYEQRKDYRKLFNTNLKFLDKNSFQENLSNCDLLINSTSLGMINQHSLQLDLKNLQKSAIVYDIVYKPLMTELLKNAEKQGNKIVTGIGMLAFQAAIGFESWFHHKAEINNKLLEFLIKQSKD